MKYRKHDGNRQKLEYVDSKTFAILEYEHNFRQITSWRLQIGEQIITGPDVAALADYLKQFDKVFPVYCWNVSEFSSFVLVDKESICQDEAVWSGFPFRSLKSVLMLRTLEDAKQVYGDLPTAITSTCENWNYSPLYLPHSASRIILNSFDCKFPKVQPYILPLLRKAKAGGLETINLQKRNQLVDCHHVDICSAYPAALYVEKFPTKFDFTSSCIYGIDFVRRCCDTDTACLVEANVRIDNFDKHKKQLFNFPTIVKSGCMEGWVGTEYDVDFLCRRFGKDVHFQIKSLYTAKKELLPDKVREAVKNLFMKKQLAKKGSPERLQAKLYVNVIAGNFQRDPEQVSRYGNLPPMTWGIWLTSIVRRKILMAQQKLMDAGCTVLYGDTDSIFWLGKEIDLNDGIKIDEEMAGGGKYAGLFYEEEGNGFIMFGKKQYILNEEIKFSGGCDEDSIDMYMLEECGCLSYTKTIYKPLGDGKGIEKKVVPCSLNLDEEEE